jgi:hypothetical protein
VPKVVPFETYLAQLREAGETDPRAAELADRYARADVVKTEMGDDGVQYDHIRAGTFPDAGPAPEAPAFIGGAGVPRAGRPRSLSEPARANDETIVVPRVSPRNLSLYYTKAPGGGVHPLLGRAEPEEG